MGKGRAASSWPLLEVSGGGGRDRTTIGAGCRRALAGRKGPAAGVGGYQRALAERWREEGAGGELWPGGDGKKGPTAGAASDGGHRPVEAPQGMAWDGVTEPTNYMKLSKKIIRQSRRFSKLKPV